MSSRHYRLQVSVYDSPTTSPKRSLPGQSRADMEPSLPFDRRSPSNTRASPGELARAYSQAVLEHLAEATARPCHGDGLPGYAVVCHVEAGLRTSCLGLAWLDRKSVV